MKSILIVLIMPFFILAQPKKDTIRVFYLGGQSNMEGFGFVKNLPDSLNKKNKNVFIYHGNSVEDNNDSFFNIKTVFDKASVITIEKHRSVIY